MRICLPVPSYGSSSRSILSRHLASLLSATHKIVLPTANVSHNHIRYTKGECVGTSHRCGLSVAGAVNTSLSHLGVANSFFRWYQVRSHPFHRFCPLLALCLPNLIGHLSLLVSIPRVCLNKANSAPTTSTAAGALGSLFEGPEIESPAYLAVIAHLGRKRHRILELKVPLSWRRGAISAGLWQSPGRNAAGGTLPPGQSSPPQTKGRKMERARVGCGSRSS